MCRLFSARRNLKPLRSAINKNAESAEPLRGLRHLRCQNTNSLVAVRKYGSGVNLCFS